MEIFYEPVGSNKVWAAAGGLIALLFITEGPDRAPAPRFNRKYSGEVWRDGGMALANLGYFGHMWELYAAGIWAMLRLRRLPASARMASGRR